MQSIKTTLPLFLVLSLAACGGGGGGPKAANDMPDMPGAQQPGTDVTGGSGEQPATASGPRYTVTGRGANARVTGLAYSTTDGVIDRMHVATIPGFAAYGGFVYHSLQSTPRPDNPEWFDIVMETTSVSDGTLSWGIWLGPSLDGDPLNPQETAFHHGPSYDASSLAGLTGRATYRGMARAHARYGDIEDTGHHDEYALLGEATLTADFTAETLSGFITDRRVNNVLDDERGTWNIRLGAVPLIAGSADFSSGADVVTATFVPGADPPYGFTPNLVTTATGSWQGSFRGTETDGSPSGVTGTFSADAGSAGVAIAGSFGASKR